MKTRVYYLLLPVCFGLLTGCSKGNETINTNACQLSDDKFTAFSNATKAFATAQTPANCQAYKTAALAYINAAATCTAVSKADLDTIRKDLNAMTC